MTVQRKCEPLAGKASPLTRDFQKSCCPKFAGLCSTLEATHTRVGLGCKQKIAEEVD